MDVIFNNPINITLSSAKLVLENAEDGVGIVEFQIFEQPCRLVITSTEYYWDTIFSVGDRVRLTDTFGALETNSEGELKEIIIDPTEDKADVLFDTIYPDQSFDDEHNEVQSSDISLLFRVPLNLLAKV